MLRLLVAALLCALPRAGAQEAVVELFGPPKSSALCRRCTCVACPCVVEHPECAKCDPTSLVVRIHVAHADGECHATRIEPASPFVDMALLAPMQYMAVVSQGGAWLSADGATKSECEIKAAGLVQALEAGEFDARTDECFPGSPGSYLQLSYNDPDDYALRQPRTQQKSLLAAVATEAGMSYALTQLTEAIPLLVPPALVLLYLGRNHLPRVRHSTAMKLTLALPVLTAALLLVAYASAVSA
eukprot:TRINITY_DN20440_c0_g1_i1.p1 TRINITY_DN20440_c0_g1~~TRINITY_DN20440_c0_g1_i1.p1  ORF type:complete len:243 (+),score=67.56 TRINITY_DN20440_c0_g1_i1:42-770(+)